MILVRINHDRCNEWDGQEFLLYPNPSASGQAQDWTEEAVRRIIDEVQEEMIDDAKLASESPKRPPHWPDYAANPDMKVADVQTLHAKDKEEYQKWLEENKRLTRSLQDRLRERGFIGLWEENADVIEVNLYWGHNHGLRLNYKHAEPIGLGS